MKVMNIAFNDAQDFSLLSLCKVEKKCLTIVHKSQPELC